MANQPKRQLKKTTTVREQTTQKPGKTKPRRLRQAVTSAGKPVSAVRRAGAKEYYLPLPDTRVGRFLNKRRRVIPRYFRESFKELREVTWPNRKETFQLTVAVFVFAIIFGVIITITDYGLDKLFKKVLLK